MLNKKTVDQLKNNLAVTINLNCKTHGPDVALDVAEEVMDRLDTLLFSEIGLEMTEQEVNSEVATMIWSSLKKRGLELREVRR